MAIERTEMIVLWCLIGKNVFEFGFEKRGTFFTKFYSYIKRSMDISGKG